MNDETFLNDEEKDFWKAIYLSCIRQPNVQTFCTMGDEIALELADAGVQFLRERKDGPTHG